MKRRKFLIHSGMATGAVLLAPNLIADNLASKKRRKKQHEKLGDINNLSGLQTSKFLY